MIKNWHQFINESVNYWISSEDIDNLFLFFKDEGYKIFTEKCIFEKDGDKIEWVNPDGDIIKMSNEYYPGYRIVINSGQMDGDDVTMDFKSALSHLRDEGYTIRDIYDDDGNISADCLHFKNGQIITWIPEVDGKPLNHNKDEWSDGDVLISSAECRLFIYQEDLVSLTEKEIADIYKWRDYVLKNGKLYFEISIDDLSDEIIDKSSSYKDLLVNGVESDSYERSYYEPDIQTLFNYTLDKENEILAVRCLIKEYGGLDEIGVADASDKFVGKTEDEVIQFLLTERFYKTLSELCRRRLKGYPRYGSTTSDIIQEIQEICADYGCQAHCDQNQKDLEDEFDGILSKEDIEFEKVWKEGRRYYLKKSHHPRDGRQEFGMNRTEKVYYDDNIWFYIIRYNERWITDYGNPTYNSKLCDVFRNWSNDQYFRYNLNPNFKDWGDVDDVELNKEIKAILNNYLSK